MPRKETIGKKPLAGKPGKGQAVKVAKPKPVNPPFKPTKKSR